jgi:hypothetical protein
VETHRTISALRLAAITVPIAVAVAPVTPVTAPVPEACGGWEVEYALSASLELSDTPFGEDSGTYAVGPGSLVLRFEDRDGQPGGTAALLSYVMPEHFTVVSVSRAFPTSLVTDADSRATPNGSGVVARGWLAHGILEWSTDVAGYRTDGTVTCAGMLCDKFGWPPPGTSEFHVDPGPVRLESFEFASNLTAFAMASTFVEKTEMPKRTEHLTLQGLQTRRSCVSARTGP